VSGRMERPWRIAGLVEAVDRERGSLRVWLEGWEDTQETPITPDWPAWALTPGQSFTTTIPRRCVRARNLDGVAWGPFSPQHYGHLSQQNLIDTLSWRMLQSDPEAVEWYENIVNECACCGTRYSVVVGVSCSCLHASDFCLECRKCPEHCRCGASALLASQASAHGRKEELL
jgi:hypothetical protein